jgi:hypothetical protein
MRYVTAIAIILAISATSHAAEGVPSQQVLAQMGLGGLQVMSDVDASAVRGSGFDASDLDGFEHYRQSIVNFREHVADFQDRIDGHVFKGKARFEKSKENFHKHVMKFHQAVKR